MSRRDQPKDVLRDQPKKARRRLRANPVDPILEEAPRARIRVTGRAAILLALVAILIVASVYPVRLYFRQEARLAAAAQVTAELQARHDALTSQVVRLEDPDYLEQLARACLGMVRRGETAFVVIPKNGRPPEPTPCTANPDELIAAE